MQDIIIQIFGLVGFVLLIVSYWKEDIKGVLYLQVLSGIFYAIHYYLLGAATGLFIILFELIRDFCYYKTNLGKYIFIGTIPFYILILFFSYKGVLTLFPMIASVIDGYGLASDKKNAVLGAIISNVLWLIYDIISHSYVGIFAGIIMIVSNFMVLFFSKGKVLRKVK